MKLNPERHVYGIVHSQEPRPNAAGGVLVASWHSGAGRRPWQAAASGRVLWCSLSTAMDLGLDYFGPWFLVSSRLCNQSVLLQQRQAWRSARADRHCWQPEPVAEHSAPGGWRGLHMAKTRVTFGRGPDVMAGAGTGHRPARMSHWEGAPPTLRSGPVGGSAFFPKY